MTGFTAVTINARKFDHSVHRSWRANLIEKSEKLFVFRGVFESRVDHDELGVIEAGTVSFEYYWPGRWYNVFRFHEPDGRLRNWYCNVNLPPVFDGETLDYVDLDLDILVGRDLIPTVLDREEFVINADRFGYPADIVGGAESALEELLRMIGAREFPFSDFE